jgi:predicted Fe-Mo cluster-binding NifX family protein
MLVDTDTMEAVALPNPAINASGGAGIASAQFIVQQGAQAVLSNNIGPNAMQVLQTAGVTVYTVGGCTVRQAVQALRDGDLQTVGQPTVPSDFGKPEGGQRGIGMGPEEVVAALAALGAAEAHKVSESAAKPHLSIHL